jgi:hypothetical protein
MASIVAPVRDGDKAIAPVRRRDGVAVRGPRSVGRDNNVLAAAGARGYPLIAGAATPIDRATRNDVLARNGLTPTRRPDDLQGTWNGSR